MEVWEQPFDFDLSPDGFSHFRSDRIKHHPFYKFCYCKCQKGGLSRVFVDKWLVIRLIICQGACNKMLLCYTRFRNTKMGTEKMLSLSRQINISPTNGWLRSLFYMICGPNMIILLILCRVIWYWCVQCLAKCCITSIQISVLFDKVRRSIERITCPILCRCPFCCLNTPDLSRHGLH